MITRRNFLRGSALLAGGAVLTACSGGSSGSDSSSGAQQGGKGSATRPLPVPKQLRESPLLRDAGLPPLRERLPRNPYVVPHKWLEAGKYGGSLNMNVFSSQGAAKADSDLEFFYGHSPLRFLNDAQDIGPGLVEQWESNPDATEWTFRFREGLKWSDGHPWTTADVLFWWEDFILDSAMGQSPPDECRSGKGTLCEMTAIDDVTLRLVFDAPAPLTADRMAMWVNGGVGNNGSIWMLPRHYLEQFHPKHAKGIPDDWDSVGGLMESKADWHRNPECPTMTGFRCKSFDNNKGVLLERNPFYYAVSKNGDQLPYIDEISISVVQDAEAGKLQVQQGQIDFCMGTFNQIVLADVQGIRDQAESSGLEIVLWDSGSGTGSIFFFNYDYVDDDIRELIREPRFRQAISLAFDREAIRKGVYFETGAVTTGTMSPKAMEYNADDAGKKMYDDWRTAHVDYDPSRAEALLDELDVKDVDGDGLRELPNGKKLALRIDYSADASQEHQTKDQQLVADLEKVGLKMTLNPIPPQSFDDRWMTGTLMAHSNWEVGGSPNHLVQPQFIVPIEYTRWAPLQGQFYQQRGTSAEHEQLDVDPWKRTPPRMEPEQGSPIAQLWSLYDEARVEADQVKRTQLVWEIIKIHIEHGPFFMGCVANYPQVVVLKSGLRNVPRKENLALGGWVNPWVHPVPAVYDPETWYWDDPSQHS